MTRFDTDEDADDEWNRFPDPVLDPATDEGPDDDWCRS